MARRGADRSGRSAGRGRRTFTVREGDRAVDGATIVRAVVHARLLGVRLLTLDARVVVAPAEVEPASLDLMTPLVVDNETAPRGRVMAAASPAGAGGPPSRAGDGGVNKARELLAEGTHALARAAGHA